MTTFCLAETFCRARPSLRSRPLFDRCRRNGPSRRPPSTGCSLCRRLCKRVQPTIQASTFFRAAMVKTGSWPRSPARRSTMLRICSPASISTWIWTNSQGARSDAANAGRAERNFESKISQRGHAIQRCSTIESPGSRRLDLRCASLQSSVEFGAVVFHGVVLAADEAITTTCGGRPAKARRAGGWRWRRSWFQRGGGDLPA